MFPFFTSVLLMRKYTEVILRVFEIKNKIENKYASDKNNIYLFIINISFIMPGKLYEIPSEFTEK